MYKTLNRKKKITFLLCSEWDKKYLFSGDTVYTKNTEENDLKTIRNIRELESRK